jgi:sec-independent protein translocase protein TatA
MLDLPVLFVLSPIQIAVVLLIALIVFGPNKLPEIGKQLGSALRELRKATSDVARSFSTDYEPDPEPYHDSGQTYGVADYGYRPQGYTSPPDLTDYSIAGLPPNDQASYGYGDQEVEDAYAISAASSASLAPDAAQPAATGGLSTADAGSKDEPAAGARTEPAGTVPRSA